MEGNNAVCWYCHDNTMEPAPGLGNSWLKCSKCRATKVLNPTKLGAECVVEERIEGYPGLTHRRPSLRRRRQKATI